MARRNQSPESQKKTQTRTNSFIRRARPKIRKIEQRKPSNELLSRKTTKMYMQTTKMTFPTHREASALKEHIMGLFTCFTLSTMINQKTDLNTSLDNDYCSTNITITLILMPKFKLLEIKNVL